PSPCSCATTCRPRSPRPGSGPPRAPPAATTASPAASSTTPTSSCGPTPRCGGHEQEDRGDGEGQPGRRDEDRHDHEDHDETEDVGQAVRPVPALRPPP